MANRTAGALAGMGTIRNVMTAVMDDLGKDDSITPHIGDFGIRLQWLADDERRTEAALPLVCAFLNQFVQRSGYTFSAKNGTSVSPVYYSSDHDREQIANLICD